MQDYPKVTVLLRVELNLARSSAAHGSYPLLTAPPPRTTANGLGREKRNSDPCRMWKPGSNSTWFQNLDGPVPNGEPRVKRILKVSRTQKGVWVRIFLDHADGLIFCLPTGDSPNSPNSAGV